MTQPPYDQLYIYEVLGDARPKAEDLGAEFLGLWLEGQTSFIFFSCPAPGEMEKVLGGESGLRLRELHHLSYEDWQGGQDFTPLAFEGLVVVPAWQEYQSLPGQKMLRLDPGLVFGNGLHPTTNHCLEMLIKRAGQGPLGRVLDLGCGTGILGLAAILLGAESVLAVDLNPLCLSTARKNASLNHLDLELAEGPADKFIERPAQVVLANLHWEVQKNLWADAGLLEGKEDLILSGVTRSQVGFLEDLLTRRHYEICQRRQAHDTWFTLWAKSLR